MCPQASLASLPSRNQIDPAACTPQLGTFLPRPALFHAVCIQFPRVCTLPCPRSDQRYFRSTSIRGPGQLARHRSRPRRQRLQPIPPQHIAIWHSFAQGADICRSFVQSSPVAVHCYRLLLPELLKVSNQGLRRREETTRSTQTCNAAVAHDLA